MFLFIFVSQLHTNMAKRKTLLVDEHLARFAENYFETTEISISETSIVFDFMSYMGGNYMVDGNNLYEHEKSPLTIVFDEEYYYLLDRDWETYIKSCLKHLFWHKMFLTIKKAVDQGKSKNEGIRLFVYQFELDDLDIETESFRRAMTRYADSDIIRSEIMMGRMVTNLKKSKALPVTNEAKYRNQLNIFNNA